MELRFKSLPALLNHFKDEATCIKYLELKRWNGKPICPHCGNDRVYRTNRGFKCAKVTCHKKFSVTVGTVLENSKIKLSIWFAAIYVVTAHKKGISSLQLSRDLGVCQKTAWFMLHRIREMLRVKQPVLLTGEIQGDETFVGGKNKNRHANKKIKESQGRSCKDKTPVFGLLADGKVNTTVVTDTRAESLKPIIFSMVERGSIMITDEWGAYNGLNSSYQHEVLKHNANEYVRDGFHTNSIEGFWSLLKRGIFGIYHSVSPKHLNKYCDEFSYRYNTRKIKDDERFSGSLTHIQGRLTFDQLRAKK